MFLSDIKNKLTVECLKNSTVQFVVDSSIKDKAFVYCCSIKDLVLDWYSDECNYCPCNDDTLLMATIYSEGKAYPIEGIGLNEDIVFENLMDSIGVHRLLQTYKS